MSFKKAFKAIFISYADGKPLRTTYLEKIAYREDVNFHRLLDAVIQKGLDITA